MFRCCGLQVLFILAGGLTLAHVSFGDEAQSPRSDGNSIQLPSGTVVKIASFAVHHPKWRDWFPADQAFFAEKYGDETLKGMHKRYKGRLDGASAVLHENGNLKMLAYYPDGQRQGPCRVWDEDQHMLFYAKFKDGKKQGVTCLFKNGTPWLIQEWDKGTLQNETVLVRKGSDYVAVDDAAQLADAQKKLSAVEAEVVDTDRDLKNSLRKWFADETDRFNNEKEKTLTKVARAQSKAREQAIRQEADARAAAAHPYRKSGRVADADEGMATRDLKGANKNVKAVTGAAKHELSQMDNDITKHYKELYHFALAALEKSLPGDDVSPTKTPAHRKRHRN